MTAAELDDLLYQVARFEHAEAALATLSALPLAQKRTDVYPRVIEVAVGFWCGDVPLRSQSGSELSHLVEFFVRELAEDPELARAIYAALADRRACVYADRFLGLVIAARDPAAIPLLGAYVKHERWGAAVIAVNGVALVDRAIAALDGRLADFAELAVVAGYLGGTRVIPELLALYRKDYCRDACALALALAGHDDEAFFKAVSTRGAGASAKRVFAVTHDARSKRRTALALLGKHAEPALATLLVCCRLLADADVELVDAAATILHEYTGRERGHHGVFLAQARAALARGVTDRVRGLLGEIWRTIPNAGELPAGTALQLPALDSLRETLPARSSVHREPDLEAQIAEDPDDPTHYLVYADWLQARGDVRGTLIALHDAVRRDPRDTAAAAAARALLHEHGGVLLEALEARDLELSWHLGFVRSARLPGAATLDDLLCLLTARAARFLQSLVIDGDRDLDVFCAALVEHAPRTLVHVQIGDPATWVIPPALRAAFPRLDRDPATTWARALAAARRQHRLELEVDPAVLPALVPVLPGIELDVPAILRGLKAELGKQRPIGIVAALPQAFTAGSLDAFAVALAREFTRGDRRDIARWAFHALGPLGGELATRFLVDNLAAWTIDLSSEAHQHFQRIGSDAAVFELIAAAMASAGEVEIENVVASYQAKQQLDELARARGLAGGATLIDRVCPETATPRTIEVQRIWLGELMQHGHRLDRDDFVRHVLDHPVRRPLAMTLVWAEYDRGRPGGRLIAPFALARDGTLRDVDGAPYEPAAPLVGVVHPAELAADQLAAWRDTFARRELEQVGLQLDRPVFRLEPDELRAGRIVRFAASPARYERLASTLRDRGWYLETERTDDGYPIAIGFRRRFPRDPVSVLARLDARDNGLDDIVTDLPLADIHPATISEILWDLSLAHGWRD